MARLPSFDSEIEQARADANAVQDLSSLMAQTLVAVPEGSSEEVFAPQTAQFAELQMLEAKFQDRILAFVNGLGARTDAAYAAFDRVDDVTRSETFFSFFKRRAAVSFKVVRARKLVIADTLKAILLEAALVHGLLQARKEQATALRSTVEPNLVASMETRRGIVSDMDEARQKDKVLAASLATLQRKISDARDETRLDQWKAEEADAAAQRETVLSERKRLNARHEVLNHQAILLGNVIDLLNDEISIHALLLNKLNIEAERCIHLYDAAFGSLEPLLADAQSQSPTAEGAEASMPLGIFDELLTLHGQGIVTLQDIQTRKHRADEALLRRRELTSNAAG
ncbi:hypothetical protein [Agrobacterium rosae]|uniref:Uncharacterized protein n=1 Tax=Agrobacterium rosae TaxID=1972867 RepID=A0AAW9FDG2_9HYPH|nr:hypothetical protein [Agrobacterium rosae]MDX8301627.1 hypothetical protein [Agrobacterium rosae]POO57961.1 hypothetical protein CTT39_04820 [Agrobacterium rosae]